jgi:zinc transporter ZupT
VPESIEKIGSTKTMAYFFAGVVLFALLEMLVAPAHEHGDDSSDHEDSTDGDVDTPKRAGLRKRTNATKTSKASSKSAKKTRGDSAELKRMGMITFLALFIHNIPEVLTRANFSRVLVFISQQWQIES